MLDSGNEMRTRMFVLLRISGSPTPHPWHYLGMLTAKSDSVLDQLITPLGHRRCIDKTFPCGRGLTFYCPKTPAESA
jgi:hypothetical protein